MHFTPLILLLVAAVYPVLGASAPEPQHRHNKMKKIYGVAHNYASMIPVVSAVPQVVAPAPDNQMPGGQYTGEDYKNHEEISVEPRDMKPWLHKLMNSRVGRYLPIPVGI